MIVEKKLPAAVTTLVGVLIIPVAVLGFIFGVAADHVPLRLLYLCGYGLYLGMSVAGFWKPKMLFIAPLGVVAMVVALWFDGALWHYHRVPDDVSQVTQPSQEVAPHDNTSSPEHPTDALR